MDFWLTYVYNLCMQRRLMKNVLIQTMIIRRIKIRWDILKCDIVMKTIVQQRSEVISNALVHCYLCHTAIELKRSEFIYFGRSIVWKSLVSTLIFFANCCISLVWSNSYAKYWQYAFRNTQKLDCKKYTQYLPCRKILPLRKED